MIITIKRPNLREQLSGEVDQLLRREYGRDFENIAVLRSFDDGRVVYVIVNARYGTYYEQTEMLWQRKTNGTWDCLHDGFTGDGYREPLGKLSVRSLCQELPKTS